jgi:two-component system NtrC family sensor kinase
MTSPQFSLSPELLAQAFPFHLVFNHNREIIQIGEVLQRVHPQLVVGSRLEEHFKINRPKVEFDFIAFVKQTRSLFLLESLHNGMQLKGQMLYHEAESVMFFLCSVWVTDTAMLSTLGLKLKDFAIHDPIVDFLFLLQTRNNALDEAKKLTEELMQQQRQLEGGLKIQELLSKTAETQAQKLEETLLELQHAQAKLIQTEKMSSLGQLIAGIAHEINNPITFINGNIDYVSEYFEDLLNLINLYKQHPNTNSEIEALLAEIEFDFIVEDLPKILTSMRFGAERIRDIVLSLRNFSRLDEADLKPVDIHEGIESTLLILQHRLRSCTSREIKIMREYGNLPLVECFASELNQVFTHILSNAIDALEAKIETSQFQFPQIQICTNYHNCGTIVINIKDNGLGMNEEVKSKVFDPFFTTKPIGKGTGLGLSISYQIIVEKHGGDITCISTPGEGTKFTIKIPILQTNTVNLQSPQKILG